MAITEYLLTANASAVITSSDRSFNDHSSSQFDISSVSASTGYRMLVSFEEPPESIRTKRLRGWGVKTYFSSSGNVSTGLLTYSMAALESAFDESDAYANAPSFISETLKSAGLNSGIAYNKYFDIESDWTTYALQAARIGVCVNADFTRFTSSGSILMHTSRSSNPPQLILIVDDEDVELEFRSISPRSGFVNRLEISEFSWSLAPNSIWSYEAPAVKSAEFRWRVKGASEWNKINVGNALSYKLPANTLPRSSIIEWQVSVQDTNDHTVISSIAEITTAVPLSTAAALAPKNSVEDGASSIELHWAHYGSGNPQTAAEIQWSLTKTSWTTIIHTGPHMRMEVPAGTFPSGEIFWRVRTYNTDDAAGEWSDVVSFNVVAPPPAPSVRSTQSPRPTISWQSSEQQAYSIEIEGDSTFRLGVTFGAEQETTFRGYLPDGQYIVKVSVQNSLGLWSDWGTAPLNVQNAPGESITLTAASIGADVSLSWTGAGAYDSYIVYRDGEAIAKTVGMGYIDSYAAGSAFYYVRGIAGDSYADSNTVSVDVDVENAAIKTIDGGRWLYLNYSQRAATSHEMSYEREGTYMHFCGSKLPSVELSEFIEDNLRLEFAMVNESEIAEFRAMRGKLVCIKIRRGLCYICPLLIVKETNTDFFTVFEVNVRRIHYEEGADIW